MLLLCFSSDFISLYFNGKSMWCFKQTLLHSIVFCFCVCLCVSQFWYVKCILALSTHSYTERCDICILVDCAFSFVLVFSLSHCSLKRVLDNFVTSQWFNKITASSVTRQIWNYSFLVV
jgi:hypothetical protein